MNTRFKTLTMTSAALLLGLTGAGNVLAQENQERPRTQDRTTTQERPLTQDRTTTQDRTAAQDRATTMPEPHTDRVSCAEVDWHRDMMRDYPWVANACQEAIVIDGRKWARFEAEFQQVNRDGTITSDFRDDRGRSLGSVNLQPGPNQRVLLDGRPTAFSDLRRGQVLNFYAPEGEFTFTTEPGAPSSEQLQISQRQDQQSAEDRRLADQRRDQQARDDRSGQLGQAERTTDTRRATLPATAGPLPIIALGGLLSLMGGMTLSMRRRFSRKNA